MAFVAATSAHLDTAGLSMTIAWPSTTSGDIVLLCVAVSSTLSVLTDPTNFTAVDNLDESSTLRTKLYWHRCDGTETGSITMAWTITAAVGACVAGAYRGCVASGSPIDAHITLGNGTSSTSRANNAITTSTVSGLEICLYCDVQITSAQTWTPPTTAVQRASISSQTATFVSAELSDLPAATAPTGAVARTATSGVAGTAYTSYHLDLILAVTGASDLVVGTIHDSLAVPAVIDQYLWPVAGVPGPNAWPSSGQGWPRRRMVAGTPQPTSYASQTKLEVD